MSLARRLKWASAVMLVLVAVVQFSEGAQTLKESNDVLFEQIKKVHGLPDDQIAAIRKVFTRSGYIGQGNPAVTAHPVTPEECQSKLSRLSIHYENPRFEKICGARYTAPLYDPAKEKPEEAKVCIDQFEFPNIPCAYPVVWAKVNEVVQICAAEGKRICDAHEWEGACDGDLEPPDYRFDLIRGLSIGDAIAKMRAVHNQKEEKEKLWSYGPAYRTGVCGTSSTKTAECDGGTWSKCGSNTFPAGNFPDCHSPLQVYDQNGNAAESMNLPLNEGQMASHGSKELGYTELKGSWFVFDLYRAHEDWCRWRAPFWHGTRVMDDHSHANYHLGFRCCKNVK
jgi:hypothetical protein